ncbi:2-phospho-L-lactate guanylyltransferase [Rudaeicoccus suwonensis]|uniref:Phosphoenolpyruvate guanylyltransferase n=1 Tax=Rudaeicoccus suwonensis TaxID=657409 RepID=A0A561E9G9_9MICO|nr:2-phospho-L-lactate guanylyltransferase [Rudaeicoccus suwonensis]TWE12220.1 2-phospho-L-lactate guanylyltransferase [Rudaeicoccus suwonensis]
MPLPATSTWHLVVPVKDSQQAKSRLQPPPGVRRADLALAFALDTLEVVLRVVPADQVVVVTSDPQVRSELVDEGVRLIADPGRGLNAAITAGIDQVVRHTPGLPGGVLLGDLPALDEDALYDGLRACAATESAIVPDHDGTGTVLLAHHDAARLRPSFGTGSAARHARGATVLEIDLPRLRTDVDDDASLRAAVDLGVGPRTQRVLSACSATV